MCEPKRRRVASNVSLSWSREDASGQPPADAVGPGIFTAVEQQLGLRLEPAKIPTQVMVIDHVERPSAN